ncbi:hypothetical protein EW145_g333 [Phellinidium pouzarii]|uniref:Uncharacterized protein n=1 Tax=Phellinidium pouzarii TaxID=167371 RepID=A0A4S4LKK8_9AGAM|nr:hypothetical protein EW145_g333 [Phellinidium pouzarii]
MKEHYSTNRMPTRFPSDATVADSFESPSELGYTLDYNKYHRSPMLSRTAEEGMRSRIRSQSLAEQTQHVCSLSCQHQSSHFPLATTQKVQRPHIKKDMYTSGEANCASLYPNYSEGSQDSQRRRAEYNVRPANARSRNPMLASPLQPRAGVSHRENVPRSAPMSHPEKGSLAFVLNTSNREETPQLRSEISDNEARLSQLAPFSRISPHSPYADNGQYPSNRSTSQHHLLDSAYQYSNLGFLTPSTSHYPGQARLPRKVPIAISMKEKRNRDMSGVVYQPESLSESHHYRQDARAMHASISSPMIRHASQTSTRGLAAGEFRQRRSESVQSEFSPQPELAAATMSTISPEALHMPLIKRKATSPPTSSAENCLDLEDAPKAKKRSHRCLTEEVDSEPEISSIEDSGKLPYGKKPGSLVTHAGEHDISDLDTGKDMESTKATHISENHSVDATDNVNDGAGQEMIPPASEVRSSYATRSRS